MPTEITALDGGQEDRIKRGAIETLSWKLDPLEIDETLSSAEIDPIDSGLSAAQVFIDTTTVAYQFTATIVGMYETTVTLTLSTGDKKRHLLIIEVFE